MRRFVKQSRIRGLSLVELMIVVAILGILATLLLSAINVARRAVGNLPLSRWRLQPNVIIIMADDLGYADVGFQGCKDIPTPNIDSLAANGIRCTNAYVTGCVCSPTRAGLLTGRYQQRFGHDNITPWSPNNPNIGLDPAQVTMANALSNAGYVTGHIGKWHLGAADGTRPQQRGFRHHFGFLGGGHNYFQTTSNWQIENLSPILDDGRIVTQAEISYLTTDFSRQAVAFLERNALRPFFLYLGYNSPHVPLQAPQEYLDRFGHITDPTRRSYAAMVSAMDDGIGTVLDRLRKLGLEEDTLIFFCSDNGGPVTTGLPNGSLNTPLRGQKTTYWEGGIRVPFVVQWKGRLPRGKDYHHPVHSLDFFATAATVANATLPPNLDGVNLMPHLTGQNPNPPHAQLYWRQNSTGGATQWAVRSGRYKLVKPTTTASIQLYDLDADLSETTDLASQRPDLVSQLTQLYNAWNAGNIAPRW